MAAQVPRKPRQAPKSAPVRVPGEAVPPGDNLHGEEANRIQLISIVSKLSDADDKIEAAKLPLAAARKHRKTIIGLGKAAGFPAWELEARLKEMNIPSREMAVQAEREHRHRRWPGILDAQQSELMLGDKVPQDEKDAAHWAGEGYKAGLRQMSSTPPTECAGRFVQVFMKAHERGMNEVLTANAPKPIGSVREQAAADFKADEAAAKGPDDGFEASPEELAAIKPRAAVVEARESNEGEVV